jgi:hypothetical protein
MNKNKQLIKMASVLALSSSLFFSCGGASTSETATATDTTATTTATETPKEEMPEDKSKRPSPPAVAEGKAGEASIKIDYSQPALKGRKVFGSDIVPYGEVWRTGANEATTITFDKDVTVEGQKLAAGTYALFSIPNEKEWTVIFNKVAKQWGSFEYKQEEDALRVTVKPTEEKESMERFTITVSEDGKVSIQWDKTKVSFKVAKG